MNTAWLLDRAIMMLPDEEATLPLVLILVMHMFQQWGLVLHVERNEFKVGSCTAGEDSHFEVIIF
jgi:hypothetical protein